MVESPQKSWRLNKERYNLEGTICIDCEEPSYPPRKVCPDCGSNRHLKHQFSGEGKVHSITTVHEAPKGYENQTPYQVGLIKLDEGPLVTAMFTDLPDGTIEIGTPVEMVTRKLKTDGERGIIVYGPKFRPKLEDK